MNLETISAIVFFISLGIFLYLKREKIKVEGLFPIFYFSMFRTKLGLKEMDFYSKKYKKPLTIISRIGIIIGFIGMIFITGTLIYYLINLFVHPEAPSGVQLVLPFKTKATFYVPFFYWLTSLIIIAFVHEFSHGIIARVNNVPIKSSGFAFISLFLPIIPAAFVEPDEDNLRKKRKDKQLAVFAAGPFSNILLAALMLILLIPMSSLRSNFYINDGVLITGIQKGFGAADAGVKQGDLILNINNYSIKNINNISVALKNHSVNDTILFTTNRTNYTILLKPSPTDNSTPYIGVYLQNHFSLKKAYKSFSFLFSIYDFILKLFYWLFVLNLGIGLFNLAPLGIVDGGRMLQVGLYYFFNKEKADKIWRNIGFIFLAIVLILIGASFF